MAKGYPNREDLTGKKFNRWRVIGVDYDATKKGTVFWKCICECGNKNSLRPYTLKSGASKSCGCYMTEKASRNIGKKNGNWQGGRRIMDGYVWIRNPSHINSNGSGYVAEHRMVMSDCLGRKLEKYEQVHHKNRIKTDNRLENLTLVTINTHKGRVCCPFCEKEFMVR